jgi:TonB family protein
MIDPPSPLHPWPGDLEAIPGPDYLAPAPPPRPAKPEAVMAALREQIALRQHDPDVLFGAVAFAAQIMTDGSGAALGMRRDSTVVCVGRSGETAPAFGARLSESTGISGECLRTGRTLRCDDSERDPRVDGEVCRQLNLRSIAAVPVRSRFETVGILEVFSSSPRAFSDEHLTILGGLAELADMVNPAPPLDFVEAASAISESMPSLPRETESQRPAELSWVVKETAAAARRRYSAMIVGGTVLVLLLAIGWSMWRKPDEPAPRQSATTAPADTAGPGPQAQTVDAPPSGPVVKPTPERTTGPLEPASKSRGVVAASKVDFEDVVVKHFPARSDATPAPSHAVQAAGTTKNEPPPMPVIVAENSGIGEVLSSTAAMPKLDVPQATPLALEHKVVPPYPKEARLARREGTVVVRIKVNELGKVEVSKVVSGDPMLAQAVLDVLPQWRYKPASQNGKPVASETNVTVIFKLP